MHFPPQKKARGNCELSLYLLDTRSGKITRKSIFILTEQLIDQCVKDRGMGGEFKVHGLGFRVSRPERTRRVAATRSRAPVPSAESAPGIRPRAASTRPLLPPAYVPAAIPQRPLLPPANPHWPRLPPVRLTAAEASQHLRSAVHPPGPTAAQDIPNEPPSPQDIPNESRSPSPAREHRAVADSHPFLLSQRLLGLTYLLHNLLHHLTVVPLQLNDILHELADVFLQLTDALHSTNITKCLSHLLQDHTNFPYVIQSHISLLHPLQAFLTQRHLKRAAGWTWSPRHRHRDSLLNSGQMRKLPDPKPQENSTRSVKALGNSRRNHQLTVALPNIHNKSPLSRRRERKRPLVSVTDPRFDLPAADITGSRHPLFNSPASAPLRNAPVDRFSSLRGAAQRAPRLTTPAALPQSPIPNPEAPVPDPIVAPLTPQDERGTNVYGSMPALPPQLRRGTRKSRRKKSHDPQ